MEEMFLMLTEEVMRQQPMSDADAAARVPTAGQHRKFPSDVALQTRSKGAATLQHFPVIEPMGQPSG